jgi:hypothetical protein
MAGPASHCAVGLDRHARGPWAPAGGGERDRGSEHCDEANGSDRHHPPAARSLPSFARPRSAPLLQVLVIHRQTSV